MGYQRDHVKPKWRQKRINRRQMLKEVLDLTPMFDPNLFDSVDNRLLNDLLFEVGTENFTN